MICEIRILLERRIAAHELEETSEKEVSLESKKKSKSIFFFFF